jgi:hypothetical protein
MDSLETFVYRIEFPLITIAIICLAMHDGDIMFSLQINSDVASRRESYQTIEFRVLMFTELPRQKTYYLKQGMCACQ